jgi:hypothetical protein
MAHGPHSPRTIALNVEREKRTQETRHHGLQTFLVITGKLRTLFISGKPDNMKYVVGLSQRTLFTLYKVAISSDLMTRYFPISRSHCTLVFIHKEPSLSLTRDKIAVAVLYSSFIPGLKVFRTILWVRLYSASHWGSICRTKSSLGLVPD